MMLMTDMIIQRWDEGHREQPAGWDSGHFIAEYDLECAAVSEAVNTITRFAERVRAIEVIDRYDDRRRIARPDRVYLNVYIGSQAYGGPEEGGWWYDCENPVEEECVDLTDCTHAMRLLRLREKQGDLEGGQDKMRDYYSVNARGMYRVRLEPFPAEYSPKRRPHYE